MPFSAALGTSLVAGVAAMAWTALTLAGVRTVRRHRPDPRLPGGGRGRLRAADRRAGRPGVGVRDYAQDLLAVGIACATLLRLTLPADEMLLGGHRPRGLCPRRRRGGPHRFPDPGRAGPGRAHARGAAARLPQPPRGYEPFPGMFLRPDGRISPQFYHLFPSLMAVAWSIGGIRAALLVNPLLNVAADPRPLRARVAAARAPLGAGGRPAARPRRRAAPAGEIPDRRDDDAVLPARRRRAAGAGDAGGRAAAGAGARSPARRSAWRS